MAFTAEKKSDGNMPIQKWRAIAQTKAHHAMARMAESLIRAGLEGRINYLPKYFEIITHEAMGDSLRESLFQKCHALASCRDCTTATVKMGEDMLACARGAMEAASVPGRVADGIIVAALLGVMDGVRRIWSGAAGL